MDHCDQAHLERPALSRGPGGSTVDLRGDCPRQIVNVLDAVSIARGYPNRNALVVEILGDWAKRIEHETTLIHRVLGGNPQDVEARGGRSA